MKENVKETLFLITIMLVVCIFAVGFLTWANDRFARECEAKGGVVGNTSNGHKTCTFK